MSLKGQEETKNPTASRLDPIQWKRREFEKVKMVEKSEVGSALPGRQVAVTGATGFIGRHLAAALVELGCSVTALTRTGHDAAELELAGVKTRICPLRPGKNLVRALERQEVLFHLAYDFRASGADNIAAFEALTDAAEMAGCARIVHLSSAVVYDGWPNGPIHEESPITPGNQDSYRNAKITMEARLLQSHCAAAVLQPTIVYGPGSALWTNAPLAMMRRGGVIVPDPPGRCAAVYIDDVVQAALLAGSRTGMSRERYLISGPDAPQWDTFFESYGRLAGCGEVRLVPASALAAELGTAGLGGNRPSSPSSAARISARLRRLLGRRRVEAISARLQDIQARLLRPHLIRPDAAALNLYSGTPEISNTRARERLGYIPRTTFAEGINMIGSFMRKQTGR